MRNWQLTHFYGPQLRIYLFGMINRPLHGLAFFVTKFLIIDTVNWDE